MEKWNFSIFIYSQVGLLIWEIFSKIMPFFYSSMCLWNVTSNSVGSSMLWCIHKLLFVFKLRSFRTNSFIQVRWRLFLNNNQVRSTNLTCNMKVMYTLRRYIVIECRNMQQNLDNIKKKYKFVRQINVQTSWQVKISKVNQKD